MAPVALTLFGGFEARGGDGERIQLPTRKAALLLAFLALSPGRAQAREKLIGLLWGSRGEDQARSSLRHALSALRKALGAAAVVAERDAVALAPEAVEADVGHFERLVAEATPEALARAAALYRGDLLDGASAPSRRSRSGCPSSGPGSRNWRGAPSPSCSTTRRRAAPRPRRSRPAAACSASIPCRRRCIAR